MSNFVKLAAVHEVPDPGKAIFELDERIVVLFHVGGQFYCLDDVCTHDGGPLGEGELDQFTIACPRHGAKFDIRTGQALTMPATQATGTYTVKVEAGAVYVAVDSPEETQARPENGSPPVTEEAIFEELKKVIDPELFVNIVDLGLIYLVDLQPGADDGQQKVLIEMTMTSPACPAGPQLIQNSKMTVGRLPGVEDVEVKIVMDPPWTPDKMTEDARDQLGIF